jgi:hypothetical protein
MDRVHQPQELVQQKTIVKVGLAPTSLSITLDKIENFIHLNSKYPCHINPFNNIIKT